MIVLLIFKISDFEIGAVLALGTLGSVWRHFRWSQTGVVTVGLASSTWGPGVPRNVPHAQDKPTAKSSPIPLSEISRVKLRNLGLDLRQRLILWIILKSMSYPYPFHCEYHKETEVIFFQY